MSDIDFSKKINFQRPNSEMIQAKSEYEIIRQFESDRGRLINSAAIRRLQQKTQVFPLERHVSVRNRLTHSLEVQQVGRYIAKEILNHLKEQQLQDEFHLTAYAQPFESLVETACLMHDLGNPPFGHFGEDAINNWFKEQLLSKSDSSNRYPCLKNDENEQLNQLRQKVCVDLTHFEGNAQTIRLINTLLKLNLTYSQVACVLKYTRPAYWDSSLKPIPEKFNYLMKKPGYFLAEEEFVTRLRQQLDIQPYCRYPLTYIMEAADDISYCLADLEDAVEKSILTVDQLYAYLKENWGQVQQNDLFDQTVVKAGHYMDEKENQQSNNYRFFMQLRVNTIANLVPYAMKRFISHLEDIFTGEFNCPLLEDNSEAHRLLGVYKKAAQCCVFNHEEVEQLELQGNHIINGLLDVYGKLLLLPLSDFQQLVQSNNLKHYPIESRLYHKLSNKHRMAYRESIEKLEEKKGGTEYEIWEFYYRARLIQDYISGMTDVYAYDEYRKLYAIDLAT